MFGRSKVCSYICVFAVCFYICAASTHSPTQRAIQRGESDACAQHSAACQAEVSVFHFCLPCPQSTHFPYRLPCVSLSLLPARIHLLIAKRLLLIKNGRHRTAASRQGQMRIRKVEQQKRRERSSGRRNTRRTYRMSILISLHNYVRLQDPASALSHPRRHFFVRYISSQ